MAALNVLIPDRMKVWVEVRALTGGYNNASNYVRDLIRRDQERTEKLTELERLVDQEHVSGMSACAMADILDLAREEAGATRGP